MLEGNKLEVATHTPMRIRLHPHPPPLAIHSQIHRKEIPVRMRLYATSSRYSTKSDAGSATQVRLIRKVKDESSADAGGRT